MGKNYHQYIWSTLLNCFNYRSRAGRTEFLFFWLFYLSCMYLYYILLPFVNNNPIITTLYSLYSVFLLWGMLSMIALVFRRCRDIGHSSLAVLYVLFFLNQLRLSIASTLVRDDLLIVKQQIYNIPTFILILLLILIKGKYKEIENKESFFVDKIKLRYIILAIATMAFLFSLYEFHVNYEYTDWWIDEWIIICGAITVYLVIIAFSYIIYSRKLFRH